MRLFIAINLPPAGQARLHQAAAPLRATDLPVRWVAPEAVHLTLKFLGEVEPALAGQVEVLTGQIARSHQPFDLEIRGFGAFPNPNRPRVIWVGIGASEQLCLLQRELDVRLGALGFAADARRFQPHCTIGRVSGSRKAPAGAELNELLRSLDHEDRTTVQSVDLMLSRLSRAGATYECLAAVPLGPARRNAIDGGNQLGSE